MHYFCLFFLLSLIKLNICVGGIIFPVISHKLLATIGFEKTLRVLGAICLVTCLIAVISVTSNREHGKSDNVPWINVKSFVDVKFVVMTSGCIIVGFGECFAAEIITGSI